MSGRRYILGLGQARALGKRAAPRDWAPREQVSRGEATRDDPPRACARSGVGGCARPPRDCGGQTRP
jgi:hypothetical protein